MNFTVLLSTCKRADMMASEREIKDLLDQCYEGEAEKVIQAINENPQMINACNVERITPLMQSISGENDWELTRWLINHPLLQFSYTDEYDNSLVHYAVWSYRMPFDIFINLIDICLDKTVFDEEQGSLKLINMFNEYNHSPLDYAGTTRKMEREFLLYLCSIGARYWSMDEDRRNCVFHWEGCNCIFKEFGKGEVRIQTWLHLDLEEEAFLWCVAGNDYSGFKRLMKIKEISCLNDFDIELSKIDMSQLKAVAKLFNRQKIKQLWGELPTLQNLVYEQIYTDWKIKKLERRFGWTLPQLDAYNYHETICNILPFK